MLNYLYYRFAFKLKTPLVPIVHRGTCFGIDNNDKPKIGSSPRRHGGRGELTDWLIVICSEGLWCCFKYERVIHSVKPFLSHIAFSQCPPCLLWSMSSGLSKKPLPRYIPLCQISILLVIINVFPKTFCYSANTHKDNKLSDTSGFCPMRDADNLLFVLFHSILLRNERKRRRAYSVTTLDMQGTDRGPPIPSTLIHSRTDQKSLVS